MKTIELKCRCGELFDKPLNEYNRRIRQGFTVFYCSRSCSGRFGGGYKAILKYAKSKEGREQSAKNGKLHTKDEWSIYRPHLRRIKQRQKTTDITLEYLKDVFESQDGLCIYTGIELKHVTETTDYVYMASVDRIDSSKGYEKGNIQFVCACMNLAKRDMTHEQALNFIKEVKRI